MTTNGFASFDRQDFFVEFSKESPKEFLKLIWIPEHWLEATTWHRIVGEKAGLVKAIHKRHSMYYSRG